MAILNNSHLERALGVVSAPTVFWRVRPGHCLEIESAYLNYPRMMCWWGLWILCLSPTTNGNLSSSAKAAQYGAIMSPIFTVLYVFSLSRRDISLYSYLDF